MLKVTKPITPEPISVWRKQGTNKSRLTLKDMADIIGCSHRTMWTYAQNKAYVRWSRDKQRYELVEKADWVVLWPR